MKKNSNFNALESVTTKNTQISLNKLAEVHNSKTSTSVRRNRKTTDHTQTNDNYTTQISAMTQHLHNTRNHTQKIKPKHNITIKHVNAQSLAPKLDDIAFLLKEEDIDVLCITETWLNKDTSNNLIQIEDYEVFRKDRTIKGHGGVCIYVKQHYKTRQINIQEQNEEVEDIWLNIQVNMYKSFIVGAIYRAPNTTAKSFAYIEKVLQQTANTTKNMYALGDLNDDQLNSNKTKMKNIIHRLNLHQLVQTATRQTDKSKTLLDLIITNNPSSVIRTSVSPSIADHHEVSCEIDIRKKKRPKIMFTGRTKENYSPESFQEQLLLNQHLFKNIYNTDNVTTQVDIFTKSFLASLNTIAPIVTKELTRPPAGWMTSSLKNEINLKRALKAKATSNTSDTSLLEKYKQQNKKVKRLVRKAMAQTYCARLAATRHNSKKIWNIIREVIPLEREEKK